MHELFIHLATRSYGVTIARTLAPTSTEEVVAERARGGGGTSYDFLSLSRMFACVRFCESSCWRGGGMWCACLKPDYYSLVVVALGK